MLGEFRILADRGLVYMKFSGHTHIEECRETLEQLFASPEWHPGQALLIDNSAVTSYEGDFSQMQQLCTQLESSGVFGPGITPVAYYSPSDLGFGIARMAQQMFSGRLPVEIHVFREEASALAKLGQSETVLSELLAVTA